MQERILRTTRAIVAAQLIGPFLLAAAATALPREPSVTFLGFPTFLLGLAAPAIAVRLYRKMQESLTKETTLKRRLEKFRLATLSAIGCTEGAALLGIAVFHLTRDAFALVALAMHVFLTGAIWPSARRLDSFLENLPPQVEEA
jgi:hypothetical protein